MRCTFYQKTKKDALAFVCFRHIYFSHFGVVFKRFIVSSCFCFQLGKFKYSPFNWKKYEKVISQCTICSKVTKQISLNVMYILVFQEKC